MIPASLSLVLRLANSLWRWAPFNCHVLLANSPSSGKNKRNSNRWRIRWRFRSSRNRPKESFKPFGSKKRVIDDTPISSKNRNLFYKFRIFQLHPLTEGKEYGKRKDELTAISKCIGLCECSPVTGSKSGSHSATFSLKYDISRLKDTLEQSYEVKRCFS